MTWRLSSKNWALDNYSHLFWPHIVLHKRCWGFEPAETGGRSAGRSWICWWEGGRVGGWSKFVSSTSSSMPGPCVWHVWMLQSTSMRSLWPITYCSFCHCRCQPGWVLPLEWQLHVHTRLIFRLNPPSQCSDWHSDSNSSCQTLVKLIFRLGFTRCSDSQSFLCHIHIQIPEGLQIQGRVLDGAHVQLMAFLSSWTSTSSKCTRRVWKLWSLWYVPTM